MKLAAYKDLFIERACASKW